MFVYYEETKRELKRLLIYECRCNERLKANAEGSRRPCIHCEVCCEGFVYYESIKRKLNKRLILECRCDARLKVKVEGSTRLAYTG